MGSYCPPASFFQNRQEVRVSAERCTGCLRCVGACGVGTVFLARALDGGTKVEAAYPENCAGCGRCVNGCPTHAITMKLV